MQRFARLYAELDATQGTLRKLAALEEYLRGAPDADAAWAVHFLSGQRPRALVRSRTLRALAGELAGVPEWLFEESYHAVGDLAETIALLLPPPSGSLGGTLDDWVRERLLPLHGLPEPEVRARLAEWLGGLDATARFLLVKLITGGFRVGVSRQLVVRAVAGVAGIEPAQVAQRLAGAWRPDAPAWRALIAPGAPGDETTAPRDGRPWPFFLAHPLADGPEDLGDPGLWHAEWKWDGIRAQLLRRAGSTWLWTRGDELVTERFPEVASLGAVLPDGIALDGELMAWRDGAPLPFARLQRRIGRKALTATVLRDAPVAFVAFDLLEAGGVDLRCEPFEQRRARLAALVAEVDRPALVLSPAVAIASWEALAHERGRSRDLGVEGLMIKRRASAYGVGRPRGDWWKWKIDPRSVDAVLVYAQRGHGRRASLYTDYTFALWRGGDLVPFAKAYSGLTDDEIRSVDAYIRANTVERFGPVRRVRPAIVCEIGFEGLSRSSRHKSGVAVRFPRILKLRTDKPVESADTLSALEAMLQE